jgi:tetratricopeptide (TPR) repeat protein
MGGMATGANQSANELFNFGRQAFANGAYEKALNYFQSSNKAGLDSSALHYNLGATYFKLKHYDKAREAFEKLIADPNSASLAHYNLGLINLTSGDKDAARNHFKIALRTSKNTTLRNLADDRLKQLEPDKKKQVSGYMSLFAGYNDNVALIAEGEVFPSNNEDMFLEYMGGVTGQLAGERKDGLQIKASGYYLDYQDTDEFDFGTLRIGPELDRRLSKWRTSFSGFVNWDYLDKDLFEQIYNMEVKGKRGVHKNLRMRLKYKLSIIDAYSPYDSLSGYRHRMTAGLSSSFSKNYARLYYTFEVNDRDNPDFPTRQTTAFFIRRDFNDDWNVGGNVKYRLSDYSQTGRNDQKLQFGLRISRSMPWDFRLIGKYDHLRNVSNSEENNYIINKTSIGFERLF